MFLYFLAYPGAVSHLSFVACHRVADDILVKFHHTFFDKQNDGGTAELEISLFVPFIKDGGNTIADPAHKGSAHLNVDNIPEVFGVKGSIDTGIALEIISAQPVHVGNGIQHALYLAVSITGALVYVAISVIIIHRKTENKAQAADIFFTRAVPAQKFTHGIRRALDDIILRRRYGKGAELTVAWGDKMLRCHIHGTARGFYLAGKEIVIAFEFLFFVFIQINAVFFDSISCFPSGKRAVHIRAHQAGRIASDRKPEHRSAQPSAIHKFK